MNVTIPPRDQWVVRFSFDRPRPRPPPTDRHIVREPSPRMCRRFRNRRAKSHGAAGVGGTEGANLAAFCDPSSLPSLPPLFHCLSSFSSDFWGGQWNGATSERRSESVSQSFGPSPFCAKLGELFACHCATQSMLVSVQVD